MITAVQTSNETCTSAMACRHNRCYGLAVGEVLTGSSLGNCIQTRYTLCQVWNPSIDKHVNQLHICFENMVHIRCIVEKFVKTGEDAFTVTIASLVGFYKYKKMLSDYDARVLLGVFSDKSKDFGICVVLSEELKTLEPG